MPYKNVTKAIASVVAVIVLVLQAPQVQALIAPLLAAHANSAAVIAGIASIAALLHAPKDTSQGV